MIRNAKSEDIPDIQKICSLDGLKPATGCSYDNEWLEELIHSDRTFFFIYEYEGEVVGFICAEKLISDGVLVWMCGVKEEHNNKGFGVKMLQHLYEACAKRFITWMITYGCQEVPGMDQAMRKMGFQSNGSTYKEYVKPVIYTH